MTEAPAAIPSYLSLLIVIEGSGFLRACRNDGCVAGSHVEVKQEGQFLAVALKLSRSAPK